MPGKPVVEKDERPGKRRLRHRTSNIERRMKNKDPIKSAEMEKYDIGFEEALSTVLGTLKRLPPVVLPVDEVCDLIAAEDLFASADCPSATSSLKDGYAVVAKDIKGASKDHPVKLRVTGMSAAGDNIKGSVEPGLAIKVMTGALLPQGADAVIAVEFTREQANQVLCFKNAEPGRNVLFRGTDVETGKLVVSKGRDAYPCADRSSGRRGGAPDSCVPKAAYCYRCYRQ